MDLTAFVQILAVLIECAVVALALRLADRSRKAYGWLIALTFTLYVIFDLSRLAILPVPDDVSVPLFLVASLSALLAVFLILREATGATIRAIDREWL